MWSLRYKPAKDPKRLTFGVGRQVGTDPGPQAPGEGTEKKKRKKSPQRAPKIPASAFLFPEPGARGGPERASVHGHRGEPRPGALHASTSLENTWSNALKAEFNRRGEKKKPTRFEGSGKGPEEENLLGSPSPKRSPHLRCRARGLCRDPGAQVGSPREPQTSLPGPAPPEATFHRYKIKSNHSKRLWVGD